MRLKTKMIIVGAAGACAAVAGVVVAVRAVKRRAHRVIDRKLRSALNEIVQMRAEDFVPGGEKGKSVFIDFAERLDNKQLSALCALVQVGYFVKVSNIDPLRATKADVLAAVNKFRIEERLTPSTRPDMLQALNTTDTRDALISAFNVLSKE